MAGSEGVRQVEGGGGPVKRLLEQSKEQAQEDIALLPRARRVAEFLGCGYRVIGVGPGVLLASDVHPRYTLDLPEALITRLEQVMETQ
jgi:hypothetical protein